MAAGKENYLVRVDRKPLRKEPSPRELMKYFILLSNQIVIIDAEWDGMKKARMSGKQVLEMFELDGRENRKLEVTTLTHILEQNDSKEKGIN